MTRSLVNTPKSKPTCALCSQPVEISGFSLNSVKGELLFCCAGCQSIYQLLNDDALFTTPTHNSNNPKDNQK
ncbi:MAG: heavy metal translocating P-type ATPase metal-binding domain-containing protein [Methylococcales bacterium]|nr:metal-binding protein [Methylococcaceae bacterium]